MRKKKSSKTKKTEKIEIRLTKEQKDLIRNKAVSVNMTISQLVIQTALSPTSITVVPSINGKLFTELCRQGNNLNQIARNLNQASISQKIPLLNKQGLKLIEELEKTINITLNILTSQNKQ